MADYIRPFASLDLDDVPHVGGKTASLGELTRLLDGAITVPEGFAITAQAYRETLDRVGAWPKLHALIDRLDLTDVEALAAAAAEARKIVYEATDEPELQDQIVRAYRELVSPGATDLSVAVRSSATAEDLPNASFAGQHDSFLHVTGEAGVVDACRRCFASIFTDRAIVYRAQNGFDHFKVALSVAVMRMVQSDEATSGVVFTLDTESGFRDVVFVTAAYGLGESIVQGLVDPDEFYVHKPTFRQGRRAVLRRSLGAKQTRAVWRGGAGGELKTLMVPKSERRRYSLSDDEVFALTDVAIRIEDHYSARAGRPTPMDIEFAKDACDGRLHVVQARPETVASRRVGALESFRLTGTGEVLVAGKAVGERIATGRVRLIRGAADLAAMQDGEVLVAPATSPDWEPVLKRACAVVTDRGGRTCHAAIVARELGLPAVVGAGDATRVLQTGEAVTVCCAEGEGGRVYSGAVPYQITRLELEALPRTHTQVMLNLAQPDLAFRLGQLPSAGVGLARLEFIISESIRLHPMAAARPERLNSRDSRKAAQLAQGWASLRDYFVERLTEGVGVIAAAFYPRPVIVRLSDFKTNEYAKLTGGAAFEPIEENPMLGFRGAARYAHPLYADGFALECEALRRVRSVLGLTNLQVMVPFCRRTDEAERVLAAMAKNGLARGEGGLEVFVMCEIPNNVVQIDAFARLFDGFSIGSNDLTQLVLGVDRDSEVVAFDFDERDPGVQEMLRQAVEGGRRNGRHVGICGEAPATYPEIADFLVRLGIGSISVNPQSLAHTLEIVARAEQRAEPAPQRAQAL
jgi:pyruvate,water dikinase